MKQAMAIGARRMTIDMRRIVTANSPSIASSSSFVSFVCTSTRPMPKKRAKTITANMSLSAIAAITLSGMIAISACMPVGVSAPRSRIALAPWPASASSARACAGSTPLPGCSRLTSARLMTTAIPDTISV